MAQFYLFLGTLLLFCSFVFLWEFAKRALGGEKQFRTCFFFMILWVVCLWSGPQLLLYSLSLQ